MGPRAVRGVWGERGVRIVMGHRLRPSVGPGGVARISMGHRAAAMGPGGINWDVDTYQTRQNNKILGKAPTDQTEAATY